ncbi:sulfhydryl oxidase 1-like [Drosophila rhopaloa]|uniref:Sulfhydryl oxidase n=1 Tax=Drosophila rhopaloa TaxID=1041015 RepID=A0A6P4FMT3_DRORH|nr:sulfhydryl oxidase 1-like [Drosophila rhopaloa]
MIRLLKTLLYCLLFLSPEVRAATNARVPATEASLYSEADNVIMLDIASLRPALNLKTNKLVQFLNTFCGDCQRFAPIYKGITRELYKWRRLLRFYAVDCAQERNAELCREYNILETPTLRFFTPDPQPFQLNLGYTIPTQMPKLIPAILTELLSRYEYEADLANFRPLNASDTAKTLFLDHQGVESPVKFIALVLQRKYTYIGRDTLLELLPFKEVAVRIVPDAQIFTNFGLKPSNQTLAIIDRSGSAQYLAPSRISVKDYAITVGEFLKKLNYKPDPPLPISVAPNVNEFLDQRNQAVLAEVLKPPLKVYRADLEQAIDKLLHIELHKRFLYQVKNLEALKNIINVMSYLNPLNRDGRTLLTNLNESVGTNFKNGSDFKELIDLEEKSLKAFKAKRYIGCIGSRPFLRSFTCSLWTLFHHWTVEAAKAPQPFMPGEVLSTIHGFVEYFFGCSDCAQHFLEMAKRRNMNAVKTYDEQILWLWEAHNEVNQRLAGDPITEDPKFPKIQFPSVENCPTCRNDNSEFQKEEVLKYLKSIYDIKNLSFYGLPTSRGYD